MYLKRLSFKSYVHWITAFAVFILMMQVGIQIGWTAPNIAKLSANDSTIPLNSNQVSWIVSVGSLGGILGAVIGTVSLEVIGSRMTIIMAFVFMIASWTCLIVAKSVIWLYTGRIVGGIAMSISFSSFSIYLGEIANPKTRGTIISLASSGNCFGVIVGTVAETYLPMEISSSIYLVQCILALLLFLWLKDSPFFLVKKGELEQARKSIVFYHSTCDVDKKMEEVRSFIETDAKRSYRDKLRDLNSPVVKKSLFLILILFILPHLSGTINLASYMEVILKKGKSHLINPQEFVIYANITSVISTVFTFKLIDILGRRILLIISSIGTATAMIGLGLHFYLLKDGFDAERLQWLPVVCILGYLVTYAVGFSPVPSTVLSELFSDNVKSMAALVATLSVPFFSFAITKAYQPMVDLIGETYVFWIHAVLSFAATPYALFLLPETKGKTFQEIQESLNRK